MPDGAVRRRTDRASREDPDPRCDERVEVVAAEIGPRLGLGGRRRTDNEAAALGDPGDAIRHVVGVALALDQERSRRVVDASGAKRLPGDPDRQPVREQIGDCERRPIGGSVEQPPILRGDPLDDLRGGLRRVGRGPVSRGPHRGPVRGDAVRERKRPRRRVVEPRPLPTLEVLALLPQELGRHRHVRVEEHAGQRGRRLIERHHPRSLRQIHRGGLPRARVGHGCASYRRREAQHFEPLRPQELRQGVRPVRDAPRAEAPTRAPALRVPRRITSPRPAT